MKTHIELRNNAKGNMIFQTPQFWGVQMLLFWDVTQEPLTDHLFFLHLHFHVCNFGGLWSGGLGCNSCGHPQNSKPLGPPKHLLHWRWTPRGCCIFQAWHRRRVHASLSRGGERKLCGWSLLVKCDTTYATFIWYIALICKYIVKFRHIPTLF